MCKDMIVYLLVFIYLPSTKAMMKTDTTLMMSKMKIMSRIRMYNAYVHGKSS